MAKLMAGGQEICIAPFKLREIRQAVPYIEKVNEIRLAVPDIDPASASQRDGDIALRWMTDMTDASLRVLCIGVRRSILNDALGEGVDPIPFDRAAPFEAQIDAICDEVEGRIDSAEMEKIQEVMGTVLSEAGLRPEKGDDPTLSAGEASSPSADKSKASSRSSSQPASAPETGIE